VIAGGVSRFQRGIQRPVSGDAVIRRELCAEAIRLARLIREMLPAESEARALLALMLLHDSRKMARVDGDGDAVLLEDQNRSLMESGRDFAKDWLCWIPRFAVERQVPTLYRPRSPLFTRGRRAPRTPIGSRIAALYQALLGVQPSACVELNHAAAVAMAEGPGAGLRLLDTLERKAGVTRLLFGWPAARGDFLRRLQQWSEAALSYRRALAAGGQ